MSVHLARAQLLLQQSRPADAEREAGLAVAQGPDQPQAHALLALSRLELKKNALALMAARTALGLAPDSAYYHYINALVLHRMGNNREALPALAEAIRLAPEDADNFSLQAAIQLNLGNWPAALAAAEQALALEPEQTEAANFRSMALVRLGRKEEAMATVDSALERDPESAFSHANQGWNCLHRNDPKRALEHFKEALRLNPELEYAREGMVEALKAHNPVYRVMLAYFLWMGRLSSRAQWGVIIGIYVGRNLLRELGRKTPALEPFITPILILATIFVFLTWTAQPLFNLLLLLHPYGRHALSREQRRSAKVIGGLLAIGLGLIAAAFLANSPAWLLGGLASIILMIPVTATFNARPGPWRWGLGVATVLLAASAAGGVLLLARNDSSGNSLLSLFFGGIFVLSLVSNFSPRRA